MKKLLVIFCCILVFQALPVAAAVTVSNLNQSNDKGYIASASRFQAQGFTTDNNSYLLTSVTIIINAVRDNSGNFVVRIYDDDGGKPGSALLNGLLVGPINPSVGQHTYNASGNISLQPNTDYWVAAEVSGGDGNYQVAFTNSLSETGNWSIIDHSAYSGDSGATWSTVSATSIMLMSVSASKATQGIPTLNEWGMILLSLFLAGIAIIMMRRRQIA